METGYVEFRRSFRLENGTRHARFLGSMPHTQTSVSKQDKSVLRVYRNRTEVEFESYVSCGLSRRILNRKIGTNKALEKLTMRTQLYTVTVKLVGNTICIVGNFASKTMATEFAAKVQSLVTCECRIDKGANAKCSPAAFLSYIVQ